MSKKMRVSTLSIVLLLVLSVLVPLGVRPVRGQTMYTVYINICPSVEAGTILLDGQEISLPYEGQFEEGWMITLEVIPNEGYEFDCWDVYGEFYYDEQITLTITSDLQIYCYLIKLPKFTLSLDVSPSGAGKILLNGTELVLPSTIETYGSKTFILQAVPNEGWEFAYWTDGMGWFNESNPLELYLEENITLYAVFETIPKYTLTIDVSPSGAGKIYIDGNEALLPFENEYYNGTVVSLEAVPNEGWEFKYWTDGKYVYYDNPLTVTMTSNISLTCCFEQISEYYVNIVIAHGSGQVIINGSAYSDGQSAKFQEGETISIDVQPSTGYVFEKLIINNVEYSTTPVELTVSENVTVEVYFLKQVTVTIDINGNGYIVVDSQPFYDFPVSFQWVEGEAHTLEAIPADSWAFDYWDIAGQNVTDNPMTYTVPSADTTIVCYFKQVSTTSEQSSESSTTETTTSETTTQAEEGIIDRVKSWWSGLSTTYKVAVVGGALLFILILLFAMAPSSSGRRRR